MPLGIELFVFTAQNRDEIVRGKTPSEFLSTEKN
jgi:hypothetical protein